MKKVSIIIPIYNVEKYLKKCLETVIDQTYSNIEIILVDDGSPDNCGKICDEYEKKDKRIKVIHKINGGLSDARNKGIEIATGDYFFFLDSDDFLEKDAIEFLVNLLEQTNSDISACSIFNYNPITGAVTREEKSIKDYTKELNIEDALQFMLDTSKGFSWKACNKLYKKELFYNVRYPIGKIYEDVGTTYRLILNSQKIVYSSVPKYYYVYNDTSITKTYRFDKKECCRIEMAEQMCTEIKLKLHSNKELLNKLIYFNCTQYVAVVNVMIRSKNYDYYIIKLSQKLIRKNLKLILKYSHKIKKLQYICFAISFKLYSYFFRKKILKEKKNAIKKN